MQYRYSIEKEDEIKHAERVSKDARELILNSQIIRANQKSFMKYIRKIEQSILIVD